jgi:hypothetical protein
VDLARVAARAGAVERDLRGVRRRREPDVHVHADLVGRQIARGGGRDVRALAAGDARAVGPDRRQPLQAKLSRREAALVDLELGDAPVVVRDALQAIVEQPLEVAVLLLEVMLADQQPLGPNRFARHLFCPRGGGPLDLGVGLATRAVLHS